MSAIPAPRRALPPVTTGGFRSAGCGRRAPAACVNPLVSGAGDALVSAPTMERENHCENCGFDLARLDLAVLYARKGMETRRLHCPICRSDRVKLKALERVFPRPSKIGRAHV